MFMLINFCCIIAIAPASCYDILFIPSFFSPSHKLSMVPWADALAQRGHNVLMWEPVNKPNKYLTKIARYDQFQVRLPREGAVNEFINDNFVHENATSEEHPIWARSVNVPGIETLLDSMLTLFCQQVLHNLWQSKVEPILNQHWDMVIIDELFNPCGFIVAQELKRGQSTVVSMFVSTSRLTVYGSKYTGVPQPPSYIPNMGMLQIFSDKMNYMERVHSSTLDFILETVISATSWVNWYLLRTPRTKHIWDMKDVTRNPALVLNNYNKMTDSPNPIFSHFIHIGGLQVPVNRDANLVQPFKNDVEATSNRGTIVIAFGHTLPLDQAPEWIRVPVLTSAQQFAEDGYVVYVQYHGNDTANYPLLKFLSWLPLYQILAHEKTLAMIGHGGGNTIVELIQTGKPALLLPMNAEQPDGSARAVRLGMAIAISKLNINTKIIHKAVETLLHKTSYKERAGKVSSMVQDRLLSPEQISVFYTEFAIRHKDYTTFRRLPKWITQPGIINFIVYHNLDVITLITTILSISLYILYSMAVQIFYRVK